PHPRAGAVQLLTVELDPGCPAETLALEQIQHVAVAAAEIEADRRVVRRQPPPEPPLQTVRRASVLARRLAQAAGRRRLVVAPEDCRVEIRHRECPAATISAADWGRRNTEERSVMPPKSPK